MIAVEARKKYSEREIAALLEDYIADNELASGVRLSTSAQLAEKYDVSLKTVHRAVARLVKKGMVYRIPGNGTFVRNYAAAETTLQIALFLWKNQTELSMLDQAAFDYFTDTLTTSVAGHGHRIELFQENTFNKAASRILQVPLDKFDVVIAAAGFLEVAEEKLRHCRAHVILINDDIIHPGPWHQLIYDYHAGFGKALKYFKNQGYCRFFIPAMTGIDAHRHRFMALRDEALRLGIAESDLLHYESDGGPLNIVMTAGRNCGKYYLEHCERDTAIISVSDYLSVGMAELFRERGLAPGQDVKLISYDNLESRIPEHQLDLGFTGITHPLCEFSQCTVRMLNDLTRQLRREEMYRVYIVPAREFVIRRSA